MTKTIYNPMHVGIIVLVVLALMSVIVFYKESNAQVSTQIQSQMALGARGAEVSKLQAFLATNSYIYPEGIVSGYYGPLTARAVMQFQLAYDISPVGRVGPITLAKINSIINSGLGLDISSPSVSGVMIQKTNTTASFLWNTSEPSRAKVYYSTSPIVLSETDRGFTGPTVNSTSLVSSDISLGTSKNVNLTSLQPNTLYYYFIESVDASGNVSVMWPSTFRTN